MLSFYITRCIYKDISGMKMIVIIIIILSIYKAKNYIWFLRNVQYKFLKIASELNMVEQWLVVNVVYVYSVCNILQAEIEITQGLHKSVSRFLQNFVLYMIYMIEWVINSLLSSSGLYPHYQLSEKFKIIRFFVKMKIIRFSV